MPGGKGIGIAVRRRVVRTPKLRHCEQRALRRALWSLFHVAVPETGCELVVP